MNDKFVKCLNEHVIFKNVSETFSEREKTKCLRLITSQNDILYVWNNSNHCVDSVKINDVLNVEDSQDYVTFVPTPSVRFDVEQISVNKTSTILLLYGAGGATVVNLPDRWMLKEKRVELSTYTLAQRVFLVEHCVLRQIKWHPYSPTDSHLLLLTSDEKLRLYNVADSCLLWECSLSNHIVRRNLPGKITLGETPVDFDFGLSEISEDSNDTTYPVFIVWGNGDVYSIDTKLDEGYRAKLQGPFKVLPAADDNYGFDGSSIAVMETSPPLVVIANNNGLLYHCLLLPEDSNKSHVKVLHVVERIELELGLSLGTDIADNDIVTCTISLEKDPHLNCRYFCFHNAGIHSVLLPIVSKLITFCQGDKVFLDNIQSSIEYLLCTAITTGPDITSSPILGYGFLDFTKLLVLLSSGKLLNVPIVSHSDNPLTEILTIDTVDNSKSHDNFQYAIENLLKDGGISSCPLIKLPGSGTQPKDWLEIVLKGIQSYRAVLKTHSDVAVKIQQKIYLLKATLCKQVSDIGKLNDDKAGLRSTAEQIAEKYEEINEKQLEIMKRTEKLLLKIECSKDSLESGNEKKMASILAKAKTKMAQLERDIKAVQSFSNQLENYKLPDEKEIDVGNKTQMLYKNLKHLSVELAGLKRRVTFAQDTVSAINFQE